MNILFISHERELNGASLSLLGIIDEIKDKHTIYVLSPYKDGKFINEVKKRNIKVIYSTYRWWMIYKTNNSILWLLKRIMCLLRCQINYVSAIRISKKIKKYNIDLIHTNTSVINIGGILNKITNIPHIWHIREFGQEDFNLHYVYSQKYTLNYINDRSNKVIAVSEAIRSKYEKYFDDNKIQVIYNGVNRRNIINKLPNRIIRNINLIICGTISKAKGQEEAIWAISELVKRGYLNIKLNVVGGGDLTLLKYLTKKLMLDEYVNFLGRIENMPKFRNKMDIELVCSKSEAFGRVTIEAMMGKIPVIGANTGGTKELIINELNGLLYKQGDYLDLADKIEVLLKYPNKIIELGENAQVFSKKFTVENNAEKILELYNNIRVK